LSYRDGDAQVTILGAGRATLEVINPAQRALIDDVEVGSRVAPRIRVAFEVADATRQLDTNVAAVARMSLELPSSSTWSRSLKGVVHANYQPG